MSQDNQHPRKRLLYGRQQGHKLRARQQELLNTLLPQLTIELPETGTLDPQSLFETRPASVFLEIGFGGGEHLAARAAEHPAHGYL
ncbi:MAG: tRNA (guanosine(46)-N7)-methyltransferase TrmB, partial [Pseudomonadota bacterium]